MRSEGRYLGLGLVIGASVAGAAIASAVFLGPLGASLLPSRVAPIVAAGSSPASPATDTATPAASSTFTPVPQLVTDANIPAGYDPASTPTADPVIVALNSGGLSFSGPLTKPQQINIYRASLAYARTSVSESKQLAKAINGVGYGDPTNICGPLAIAILRDAGVISADVVPHDFWLLDPRTPTDQRILARAFPADAFAHTQISTPLNKVDWRAAPLQPGDFVFIWHGSGGNFDHMLVVNRVDAAGRAYAVTNFGTAQGYIIAETMLYDPGDPNVGIFHTWMQERNAILGSTGFGGYELWRSRTQ